MVTRLGVDRLSAWQVGMVGFLLTIVLLQLLTLSRLPEESEPADVHTAVLTWAPRQIPAEDVASGYVASWNPHIDVVILAVQVWMGNPTGILWEGDVYVTLNNHGDFHSADQVIVHYQFDKHAESSAPHQLWFQIGCERSGFRVRAGQTVWVWFALNNLSDKSVISGDGQAIIYYVAG